jgi:hypothetical protein
VCRTARQSSELQDGVQFLGGALSENTSSECGGFARDLAKVEDQARLLARTLNDARLEPDGAATGCNPVQVGSTPTGLSDTARPTAHAPCLCGSRQRVFRSWVLTEGRVNQVSSVVRAPDRESGCRGFDSRTKTAGVENLLEAARGRRANV